MLNSVKISNVIGREIIDSRGNPTVEVDVILENGGQAKTRHLSLATETKNDTAERVFLKPLKT